MKRITALVLFMVLCITLCFTGCKKTGETINGEVIITGPGGEVLLENEVSIEKNGASAADAVIAACSDKKFAYTYEDGMFDNFAGIASTMEDGWLLYADGVLAETGAKEVLLENSFVIEFRYVNYAESFNLE